MEIRLKATTAFSKLYDGKFHPKHHISWSLDILLGKAVAKTRGINVTSFRLLYDGEKLLGSAYMAHALDLQR